MISEIQVVHDDVAPPAGSTVVLTFASNQSAIRSVRVGDAAAEPIPGAPNQFALSDVLWRGSEGRVLVEYDGDAPLLVDVRPYAGDVAAHARHDDLQATWDRIRRRSEQLEAEAPELRPARRFFLRYDALTEVGVLAHISARSLHPAFQALHAFLAPAPFPFPTCVIPTLAERLGHWVQARAAAHLTGAAVSIPAAFVGSPACRGVPLQATPLEAIDGLALYQRGIFDRSFPPAAPDEPAPALLDAFTLFANGELRYAGGEREDFNAEPDSALFLAFAEFALHASRPASRAPARSYWDAMFRHFVALGEVYLARYAAPNGPRTLRSYEIAKTNHSRLSQPLASDAIRGLLEFHRARYRRRKDVEERHAQLVHTALKNAPGIECRP